MAQLKSQTILLATIRSRIYLLEEALESCARAINEKDRSGAHMAAQLGVEDCARLMRDFSAIRAAAVDSE